MAGRLLLGQLNKSFSTLSLLNNTIKRNLFVSSVRLTSDDAPINLDKNPFERPKRVCILCKMNIEPDYKNVKLLSQFQSPYTGRVYGRHITGLCKRKHERVQQEVLRAQNAGFMPYYCKDLTFINDPKLFDPDRPLRSHPH